MNENEMMSQQRQRKAGKENKYEQQSVHLI